MMFKSLFDWTTYKILIGLFVIDIVLRHSYSNNIGLVSFYGAFTYLLTLLFFSSLILRINRAVLKERSRNLKYFNKTIKNSLYGVRK